MSSTEEPVRKTKRPDMAIYTPRGRRAQDQSKQSSEETSQMHPSKVAPKKTAPLPENGNLSQSRSVPSERTHRPSEEASQPRASRAPPNRSRRVSEQLSQSLASRERSHRPPEESSQSQASRAPPEKNRPLSGEPVHDSLVKRNQGRSLRASDTVTNGHAPPTAAESPSEPARGRLKSPQMSHGVSRRPHGKSTVSTPGTHERHREATERSSERSRGSAYGAPERPRVAVDGTEGRHKGAAAAAPADTERPRVAVDGTEGRHKVAAAAPADTERPRVAVDGTEERHKGAAAAAPADTERPRVAVDGTEGRHKVAAAAAPAAAPAGADTGRPVGQRDRDGPRRPRGAAAVYVPRGARRQSGGGASDPASPADDRQQTGGATTPTRQDRGDTSEARPERTENHPVPDSPAEDEYRCRDGDRSTEKGDGEMELLASPRCDSRGEKRRVVNKVSLAADSTDASDEGGKRSAIRLPSREEDRGPPRRPVSRPRVAGQQRASRSPHETEDRRGQSPLQSDLAALTLDSAGRPTSDPPVRRSALPDPAEATPTTGLLYVPGGSHCTAPEPPPLSSPPPPPPTRHLFDPNNPSQALEVKPRLDDSRHRRYPGPSRPVYADSCVAEQPTGWSDSFSLPSSSTNASRISQLLGRAAGEIEYIIATGRLLEAWSVVARIREHVQLECARLIISDLRTWMSLSVDQTVWKALYYCVIEALRSAEPDDDHRFALNQITNEGVEFFASLLTALQSAYDMPVSRLSSLTFDPSVMRRKRFFSSVAALSQRLLLCLGDLARYQHQMGRLPNLSQAHSFYLQAQQMNPKNGRPFNQLAIVALYAHRRLDCVYLYARALMASNPFHTAKESLLSLFHEASKKYAARCPLPGQMAAPAAERRLEGGADLRTETWVHPGRGDRLLRTLQPEDATPEYPELRQTSDGELLKAFTATYLHVQGKLYTRISLESYQEDSCVMLRQFSELLSREPMPLKTADMLHILGINMFNIANTKLKDERLGSDLRSTYQELALAVAIEMAGHVIQRANQLLAAHADGGEPADRRLFQPYSLETCMVFIKVWSDWLLCSSSIWNPPPCTTDYRVADVQDCWTSLAELTNRLHERDDKTISLAASGAPGDAVVRLPEDLCLESFNPLFCANYQTVYVDTERCSLELARDLLRLRCVLFVTEQYLCGTEPAVLRLLKTADGTCRYVSQVSSHVQAGEAAERAGTPDEPDVMVEWTRDDEEESAPSDLESPPVDDRRPDLQRLQQQKVALERRARRQEEHSRRVAAIVSSAHASVVLEVRPRYLVADTNCYVDYLDELQSLVSQHSAYTLTVPVTVLAELDGLSRPGGGGRPRPGQSEDHVQHVRRTARAALAFVRQRGAPHVRCVTSRGHLLSSAVFTAEDDDDDQATNDDRILSCCRNLERGVSQEQPDGAHHVSREVVLLTDDRNLRLKAISLDVPTRTVPDFLAWAS